MSDLEAGLPKTPTMSEEADLYKSGIYLFMDVVNPDNCKEVIEFILKQTLRKKEGRSCSL